MMKGGSPYDVSTINRDARSKQEIEHVDIVVFGAVVAAHASDIAEDQQRRVRVAHRFLPPCEIRSITLRNQ